MTKVPRLQPVYASINKPLTIGGADRRLFFVALVVGGATFTLFGSLLTGLVMFLALYLGARWVTQRDPQLLRIVLRSANGAAPLRPREVRLPHGDARDRLMRRLSQIVQDYRDTGAMSTLINLYGFVDDAVFLTKSGDLGVVLALGGVDYECLDPDQREAVTRRFEVALRLWDEHTRLYQYVLKRNQVALPDDAHPNPAVDALLQRRHAFLEATQAERYTVELYLVVLAEAGRHTEPGRTAVRRFLRAPLTTIREWLSTARTVVRLDDAIERRRVQLRHQVDAFVLQLEDTVRPRVLPKGEAFTFFRRLLNYAPAKADGLRLREDTFLDYHVCDSALECHRTHLRLDDAYVRVVTLKEPPAQTFPHLFQALYEIPSNLILVNEWQRAGQGRVRKEIHARRRHFHNARVSLANYVTETSTAPGELLVDDSATAVVRDLGACLTELTLQGRYIGQYTMTVVLYDRGPRRPRAQCRRLREGVRRARCPGDRRTLQPPQCLAGRAAGQRGLQRPVDVSPQHQLRRPVAPVRPGRRRRDQRRTSAASRSPWSTRRRARPIT